MYLTLFIISNKIFGQVRILLIINFNSNNSIIKK